MLGGKLIMNFQKQYELLLNLPPQARAIGSSDLSAVASAKVEAEQKAINEKWWCVLNEARTFFEQNNE